MILKELGMISVLFFLVWSLIFANNPNDRIERVCEPVNWVGRILSSTIEAMNPAYGPSVEGSFKKINDGCKYVIWSAFYKAEYQKWIESQQATELKPIDAGQAQENTSSPKP